MAPTKTYQVWEEIENNSKITTVLTSDTVQESKDTNLLSANAKLLYEFEAATPEEASSIHNLRMGFGPYKPQGEPAPCPKCGAWYYPEGSGECWRCGKVS